MRLLVTAAALALLAVGPATAQEAAAPAPAPVAAPKAVPGGVIAPDKSIADNVAAVRSLSQTADAIRAADLAGMLGGAGPYTLFAPNNFGWDGLQPKSLQGQLMRPENKGKLAGLLGYHVVKGALTSADLAAKVKAGGGEAYLDTVQGAVITVRAAGRGLVLSDANGVKARVTVADAMASNGVIHIIDAVLQP